MLKQVLAVALIVIIAITFIVALRPVSSPTNSKGSSGVYVGMTFSGNTTAEAKLLNRQSQSLYKPLDSRFWAC